MTNPVAFCLGLITAAACYLSGGILAHLADRRQYVTPLGDR
jgi:hypothetical protein